VTFILYGDLKEVTNTDNVEFFQETSWSKSLRKKKIRWNTNIYQRRYAEVTRTSKIAML